MSRVRFRTGFLAFLAGGCLLHGAVAPVAAQVSDDAVKIGLLTDMAGPYAAAGGAGSVLAVKMAIEDFGGTVLGKPVVLLEGDHQLKPDVGLTIARRWIDIDKVDAIVDVPGSNIALAVQTLTNDRKVALLVTASGTTELIGKSCSPTTVLYAFDTYALAKTSAKAAVDGLGKTFFFITLDSAFGTAIEGQLGKLIGDAGGKVVGTVKHPVGMNDFSSMVLQAQASKADVVILANGASDAAKALRTAREFGLSQSFVASIFLDTDAHAAGLDVARGLIIPAPFYRDRKPESVAWSRRYFQRLGSMPNFSQTALYSAVFNYLKAVQASGTDASPAVIAKMKDTPIDDLYAKGSIRADGRFVFDHYLLQVKSPAESKAPWDYFKLLSTVPAEVANLPVGESACALLK